MNATLYRFARPACGLLASLCVTVASATEQPLSPAAHLVCTPQPLICTTFAGEGNERFSPLVQHLLVRRQIELQPKGWEMIYLYVPSMDPRALEEMQIRFLDELLARHREALAKAEAEQEKKP